MIKHNKINDINDYLTITIGFECNNRCISCMLEGIRSQLVPVSFETYKEILAETVKAGKFKSLILSGAEVTLNGNLVRFARYAKALNYFQHIRLQTNGRKLSRPAYCKQLVDAGFTEFFISVYGPSSTIHEALTREPHSYSETLNGIINLNALDMPVITNTVVTGLNYSSLPQIMDSLGCFPNIKHMEFWNYWPMGQTDTADLVESHRNMRQYLLSTIKKGQEKGIRVIVKGFPECLLGPMANHLNNSQSSTIIDDLYWKQFQQNKIKQCRFKPVCGAQQCQGLTTAYIKKFGWDEDILSPLKPFS